MPVRFHKNYHRINRANGEGRRNKIESGRSTVREQAAFSLVQVPKTRNRRFLRFSVCNRCSFPGAITVGFQTFVSTKTDKDRLKNGTTMIHLRVIPGSRSGRSLTQRRKEAILEFHSGVAAEGNEAPSNYCFLLSVFK